MKLNTEKTSSAGGREKEMLRRQRYRELSWKIKKRLIGEVRSKKGALEIFQLCVWHVQKSNVE